MSAEALRAVLLANDTVADPRGLTLVGAVITGSLDLNNATIAFPLALVQCQLVEPINMTNTHIRGRLNLSGTHLGANSDGDSLIADELQVDGDLFARFTADGVPFHTAGAVRLSGGHISGQLNMIGADLGADGDWNSLVADRLQVDGNLFAGTTKEGVRFRTAGAVRFIGGHIRGQVSLTGADLAGVNGDGKSLVADGLQVDGGLFARLTTDGVPFHTAGAVRFTGGHISGQLSMTGADLGADGDGNSLVADRVHVDGDLFADTTDDGIRFHTAGAVRFTGGHITNQLNMSGADLAGANRDGDSLYADGLQVDGSLFADTTKPGDLYRWPRRRAARLKTAGAIRLTAGHIGGQLRVNGADLAGTNDDGDSLVVDRLQVDGDLFAGATKEGLRLKTGGAISFRGTRVKGQLHIGRGKAELPPLRSAAGWSLTDVTGVLRSDVKAAEEWLASAPEQASQPTLELANVYDHDGEPAKASWLRYKAAVRATKRVHGCRTKIERSIYRYVAGHGYYPLRALIWLPLVMMCMAFVSYCYGGNFTTPTTATIRADLQTRQVEPRTSKTVIPDPIPGRAKAAWCNDKWDTACFDPVQYAIINTLPAAGASAGAGSAAWQPPLVANLILTALRLFAWTLTALFLAGVTGLLRKT